jgi:hypothetical protein
MCLLQGGLASMKFHTVFGGSAEGQLLVTLD